VTGRGDKPSPASRERVASPGEARSEPGEGLHRSTTLTRRRASRSGPLSRGAGEGEKTARNPSATPDQLIRTGKDGRITLIQNRLPRLTAVAKRKAR
jgi:hypothetical protein